MDYIKNQAKDGRETCEKSDSPPSYCCLRLELVWGEEFWREKLGSSSNRLIRLSSSKVKEYISG